MRALAIVTFLLFSPLWCVAEELHVGSMSVQWADGFSHSPSTTATRFVGPNDTVVLITAFGLREGGDPAAAVDAFRRFAAEQLPKLSGAQGKDLIGLKQEDLGRGIVLYSTATLPNKSKKMFYLQFFAISPDGRSALLTIEGKGEPKAAYAGFRPLLDSITWRVEKKSGEPGATDNPDGAQRLREDH